MSNCDFSSSVIVCPCLLLMFVRVCFFCLSVCFFCLSVSASFLSDHLFLQAPFCVYACHSVCLRVYLLPLLLSLSLCLCVSFLCLSILPCVSLCVCGFCVSLSMCVSFLSPPLCVCHQAKEAIRRNRVRRQRLEEQKQQSDLRLAKMAARINMAIPHKVTNLA